MDQAYIYGSWAARYLGEPGPVPQDVDVLAIGTASDDDLYDAARKGGSVPRARSEHQRRQPAVLGRARSSRFIHAAHPRTSVGQTGAIVMRWNQGRAEIDKLIVDGELRRVPSGCGGPRCPTAAARAPAQAGTGPRCRSCSPPPSAIAVVMDTSATPRSTCGGLPGPRQRRPTGEASSLAARRRRGRRRRSAGATLR